VASIREGAATQNRLLASFQGCFEIVAEPVFRVGDDQPFGKLLCLVQMATLVIKVDQGVQVIKTSWFDVQGFPQCCLGLNIPSG